MAAPDDDVTRLLARAQQEGGSALGEAVAVVFRELHALASSLLQRERQGHTLQPTALVNEVYLKLQQQRSAACVDRHAFLAVAATAMRRILVDHARTRGRQKRGGDADRRPLEDALQLPAPEAGDLVAIDAALDRLASVDARMAKVVELRFFAGLDPVETAAVLGTSQRTCERDWTMARAWLRRELAG